ncbi:imidazole glycerol phosphate synthase subunit HisF, partial [Escherichia coli]|nr:imidazole glycerol phosphate synthase subunit HisF [Escherichia coli]
VKIISLGVEKVSISSAAVENPNIVKDLAEAVGKQSVVVVLDVIKRKGLFSKGYELSTRNNTRTYKIDPISFAQKMVALGAGEIVINFVDNDGVMGGYDVEYSSTIKSQINVPVTFLGGAGNYEHLSALIDQCGIVGAAAGSLFVFKGKYRAVLISYPTPEQKDIICNNLKKNY